MFEYLTRLRMQKAQDLLRSSTLRLYEVASRVGYESDLAFTKAFKKLLGMTPTKYRKQSLGPRAANGAASAPSRGTR
jgi:YesN/AraC family two-component response regulator